ncbi:hypothetical protein [Caballeronia hypogeia]|uniref:hypothetical protein n=1 Tax=Caballeronia hypogeia TaxID=1777140 RepID=UPI0012FE34C4|nr:hypothetical protein [Caballeronia hypogeia]
MEKSFRYATGVLPWINQVFYRSGAMPCKKRGKQAPDGGGEARFSDVCFRIENAAIRQETTRLQLPFKSFRIELTIYDNCEDRQFALSIFATH